MSSSASAMACACAMSASTAALARTDSSAAVSAGGAGAGGLRTSAGTAAVMITSRAADRFLRRYGVSLDGGDHLRAGHLFHREVIALEIDAHLAGELCLHLRFRFRSVFHGRLDRGHVFA